jgi:transcriptional/translational regulatory protein YebC/TACO1
MIEIEAKNAGGLVKLMEHMEEHDDVQNVYTNADIPEEALA